MPDRGSPILLVKPAQRERCETASKANTISTNPTISTTTLVKAFLHQFWSAEMMASDKQEQRVEGEAGSSEEEYDEKGESVKVNRRALFEIM